MEKLSQNRVQEIFDILHEEIVDIREQEKNDRINTTRSKAFLAGFSSVFDLSGNLFKKHAEDLKSQIQELRLESSIESFQKKYTIALQRCIEKEKITKNESQEMENLVNKASSDLLRKNIAGEKS